MTAWSVFDLDRTLTRHPTYSRLLLALALAHRPWRVAAVALWPIGFVAHALGRWDRRRLKRWMHATLVGPAVDSALARSVADRMAARLVADGLLPDATRCLAAERAAGRRVLIASAANSLLVEPLARRLGVEAVSTRSRWVDGALRPGSVGPNCYGEDKLVAVAARLGARGDLHVRAFSDHASDAPLLGWADEAVAVNPSRALARLADARGWRIERWR